MGGLALREIVGLVKTWISTRNQRTTVGPQPFGVTVTGSPEFALKPDCIKIQEDNKRDHENLFGRVAELEKRTEKTSEALSSLKDGVAAANVNIDKLVWRLIPESRTEAKPK